MTWDATPTMCLLQNLATTVTREHRIRASSLSLGEHSKWREGKFTDFVVDFGTQHLILAKPQGNFSQKKSWVQGATGMSQYHGLHEEQYILVQTGHPAHS